MMWNETSVKQLDPLLLAALKEGTVSVPHLLLRSYSKLGLSEVEVMLLLHLIAFIGNEKKEFPTPEEIQSRMSIAPDRVIATLQKLLKDEMITIDQGFDQVSGIQYETYNLDPLYEKLAEVWIAEKTMKLEQEKTVQFSTNAVSPAQGGRDIFTIFEKEFARLLTPMELETISHWIEQDRYKEELILAALKEAVFAGKVHFRYIDRILLEWSRNRVFTPEQAKEYSQKFRK